MSQCLVIKDWYNNLPNSVKRYVDINLINIPPNHEQCEDFYKCFKQNLLEQDHNNPLINNLYDIDDPSYYVSVIKNISSRFEQNYSYKFGLDEDNGILIEVDYCSMCYKIFDIYSGYRGNVNTCECQMTKLSVDLKIFEFIIFIGRGG
jgi:hypothetical protein